MNEEEGIGEETAQQEELEDKITDEQERMRDEEKLIDEESDDSEAKDELSEREEIIVESGDVIDAEDEIEVNDQEVEVEDLSPEVQVRQISKNLIEGALYASGSPLTVEELATKLEIPKKLTEELVNELAFEYLDRKSALIIAQVGENWQMQLRPEYTESVSKFAKGGGIAEKYLRTLTVIALKQPILKSLLVKIRGTGAYEHVKFLIDNDLISAVKKGRTQELTTTDKYSEMFGLPKEMSELKRIMISQLGVESASREE